MTLVSVVSERLHDLTCTALFCSCWAACCRMARFLQSKMAFHQLPVVVGRFAGVQLVNRADTVCVLCGRESFADECHLLFDCHILRLLRQQCASRFTIETDICFCAKESYWVHIRFPRYSSRSQSLFLIVSIFDSLLIFSQSVTE